MYLVVDYGTSSCRASYVNAEGRVIDVVRIPVAADVHSREGVPGSAELDPETVWTRVADACRVLTSHRRGARPEALVVSCLLGYLFLDEGGKTLGPAWIWMDRRATSEAEELARALPEFAKRTGRRLAAELLLPRLAWLKRRRPDRFSRLRRVMGLKDWVVRRIVGEPSADATDYAHLNYTGLVDFSDCGFWAEAAEAVGLGAGFAREGLPEGRSAATVIGEVSGFAAAELGLPRGLPVILGSSDGTTAMYGSGVLLPRTAAYVSGTTDVLMTNIAAARFPAAASDALSFNTGMAPGTLLVGGAMGLGGGALVRFAELFGLSAESTADPAEVAETEASLVPPGSDGLIALPGLTGERSPYWLESVKGGLYGLDLRHRRGHVLRAVMEATAYRAARVVASLGSLGAAPERVFICGGGAGSRLWNQIRADVLGIEVRESADAEGTTLGSAMFARAAVTPSVSLADLALAWVVPVRTYQPNPVNRGVYDEGVARFERLLALAAGL